MRSQSAWMLLQVAVLLIMVVSIYAGYKGLARFSGVFQETEKEGAIGQLNAIESTIRGKRTLMDNENKDELSFPLPVTVDKNHVLVLFSEGELKVDDSCTNTKSFLNRLNPFQAAKDQGIGLGLMAAPTLARRGISQAFGKRCSDKEIIPRDPSCGRYACACMYKFKSDGILVNHRTCFENFELVDCRPLKLNRFDVAQKVVYGRCQELETSVIEYQVTLQNEGSLSVAAMSLERQDTGFQVRDVLG